MPDNQQIHNALEKHIDGVWTSESSDDHIFLDHLFVHLAAFDKLFDQKRFLVKSRK